MREIKFRAWSVEKQTWVYFGITNVPEWVEESEVEQFTGLRDKNGKEIYEGDIVKHNAINHKVPLNVEFLNGAFCIGIDGIKETKFKSFITIRDAMCMAGKCGIEFEMEVIGNIRENPEPMGAI